MTNSAEEAQTPTTVPAPAISRYNPSPWRTAVERADALRARKKQKRTAHRATLKRSHSRG